MDSVSSNFILNETVVEYLWRLFSGSSKWRLLGWIHLKHHAHTTADIDPDNFSASTVIGSFCHFDGPILDFYFLKAFLKVQTSMCLALIKDCLGISYRLYSAVIALSYCHDGYFAEFFSLVVFFQRVWRLD